MFQNTLKTFEVKKMIMRGDIYVFEEGKWIKETKSAGRGL